MKLPLKDFKPMAILVSYTQIEEFEAEINQRPREILEGKSPAEFKNRSTA